MRTEARGLALIGAFAGGAGLALQSRINGTLAESIGGMLAAWHSFGSGLLLLTLGLAIPSYRRRVARIPAAVREHKIRPWQVCGARSEGCWWPAKPSPCRNWGWPSFWWPWWAGS